jgi:D-alanyl-D-alanine carboxypeptidase
MDEIFLNMIITNVHNRLLITILLYCFICTAYALNNVENNQVGFLNSQVQTILDRDRIKYHLPAVSVSIQLPEENITRDYVSGYDTLSGKNRITKDTLFQIGSITKTFTATIIFKLIEENKLSLNSKLMDWFPQYPRWKDITVKSLLNHTSGVYNYTHGKAFDNKLRKNPDKFWSLDELADMAYQHPNLSKPGERYRYTNTDYILLGLVIEKVMNKSIQQVFNQYLQQYNLNNTFYSPSSYPKDAMSKMAHGYNRDETFGFNTDVTFFSMSFSQSAGAMISTPHNIIDWLDQLFSKRIINNKSLEDMMTIISEKNAKPINLSKMNLLKILNKQQSLTEVGSGSGIGLVYFKDYGFTWSHAGGTPGYESFYAYNPCNGIKIVLMYNVKPKQQLIFPKVVGDVFNVLNSSNLVRSYVKTYQHHNALPIYCKYKM